MALIACPDCGKTVSDAAPACIHCGRPLQAKEVPSQPGMTSAVPEATPKIDSRLRENLLNCYLRFARSDDLTDWLRDIGQDPKGTVEEKRARIREHTAYLTMTPETFPGQTISYLSRFTADELAAICDELGLSADGVKDELFRRIYREVGYREGWLPQSSQRPSRFAKDTVLPLLRWYPVLKVGDREKDLYAPFHYEMSEVFGEENVHEQLPVAYGSALKIDFHIGHPNEGGVGIEFKMPRSNSEVQRALGQLDQYLVRYKDDLVVMFIPAFLSTADKRNFLDELARKRIEVVVKEQP